MVFRKLLSQPLDAQLTESLIALELRRIIENCDPVSVYLFGSAARGEMTDTSDLDFLVVLSDFADVKSLKSRYYRSGAERTVPVDAVFVKRSEFERRSRIGGLCFIVADEGRLLFTTVRENQNDGYVKKI